MPLNESFEKLADTNMWRDVVILAAGYMGAIVLRNTIEDRVGYDVPDEAWGVLVVVIASYAGSGKTKRYGQFGGALYVLDSLARRFNVKSRVQNVGA